MEEDYARFLSSDPLRRDYPELTTYQFASNTPIQAIDLDGLEHFVTSTGKYLGNVGTSQELRVVNDNDVQRTTLLNANTIPYKNLMVYSYDTKTKMITSTPMTIRQFVNQAHIIYGEEKGAQADKFAHTILNREVKTAEKLYIADGSATVNDGIQTTSNNPSLKMGEKYGADYALFGMYKPTDIEAVEDYRESLDVTGIQMDGDDQNYGYLDFFKAKQNLKTLADEIPQTTSMFKAVIDARLGNTTDPKEGDDGWRGNGKTTTFQNADTKLNSEPAKLDLTKKKN